MKKDRYSTRRIDAVKQNGQASQYISHIDDLEVGPVILYLRDSSRQQKDHLKDQEDLLRHELERRGFKVVAVFREIISGWAEYQPALDLAALRAKAIGAIVVAESGCRFIRGFSDKKNPNVLPSVFEFENLMARVDGAQLATLHHVNTHWTVVRGHQSKRGQAGSGHRGGRPLSKFPLKAKRLAKMPTVLALRQMGCSLREIGSRVHVHFSTVRDWINRSKIRTPNAVKKSASNASKNKGFLVAAC